MTRDGIADRSSQIWGRLDPAAARQAETALRGAGLPQLHILDGGTAGWLAAGFPAIRGKRAIPLERQVRIAAGAIAAAGAALALTVAAGFAWIPLLVGSGLIFAGVTDICTLGLLLGRMPWNRGASCDPAEMVKGL